MTNLPEAKLAREAEISYATLAMATDYDCWHSGHDDVTVEQVVSVLLKNADLAREIIGRVVSKIVHHAAAAPHANALKDALMTDPKHIPDARKVQLAPILSKYLGG